MKVIIVGGGIGGLTLALMLHARGVSATVYEQAGEIREVGVGINTLPHAIRELAEAGRIHPAVGAQLPLSQWRTGFEAMAKRELVGKVVFEPGD